MLTLTEITEHNTYRLNRLRPWRRRSVLAWSELPWSPPEDAALRAVRFDRAQQLLDEVNAVFMAADAYRTGLGIPWPSGDES
jgi:hypothetical protein